MNNNMKSSRIFCAVFLVSSLLQISCSKDHIYDHSKLEGTWLVEDVENPKDLVISQGDTVRIVHYIGWDPSYSFYMFVYNPDKRTTWKDDEMPEGYTHVYDCSCTEFGFTCYFLGRPSVSFFFRTLTNHKLEFEGVKSQSRFKLRHLKE